jgi:hypothetical protein
MVTFDFGQILCNVKHLLFPDENQDISSCKKTAPLTNINKKSLQLLFTNLLNIFNSLFPFTFLNFLRISLVYTANFQNITVNLVTFGHVVLL